MCGICGIKGWEVSGNRRQCEEMLASLAHRGPDDCGCHTEPRLMLGATRLSIIGLERGAQPIYNEDKSLVLVCNGEIYNYHSLKEGLLARGHGFSTDTDTEVILHLYEERGAGCLEQIKGMFAFAVWDGRRRELFLARDRLGIKPLYYVAQADIVAFASEIKALLTLPFVRRSLDAQAVDLFFSLEYVPSPYSIFEDIEKLPPGSFMVCPEQGAPRITSYWQPSPVERRPVPSFDEAARQLTVLLRTATQEHLMSDVPLGIFLSGGIDSSSLTALARPFIPGTLHTSSIVFDDEGFDESPFVHVASRHFHTQHHQYRFGLDDLVRIFPEVTAKLDEPFADTSLFPTYLLSSFSRQFMKVALSGEGGDELFLGYPTYRAHRYMSAFRRLPAWARRGITAFGYRLPVSMGYFSLDFKLKQFLKGQGEDDPVLRHLIWMGAFDNAERQELFSADFTRQCRHPRRRLYYESVLDKTGEQGLKQIQRLDLCTYLTDNLLVKADRASMFSSLEVRVPLLDHELVEFALGLPEEYLFQKRIFKYAMKGLLPPTILSRKKKGFAIPFAQWLCQGRFFRCVEHFFSEEFIRRQNLFRYETVWRLLNDHRDRRKDNRKKLGAYIMFQQWYQTFM